MVGLSGSLLGLLGLPYTDQSISVSTGFGFSYVGVKDEGRAIRGPPFLFPFQGSLGADVSAKAPGYFLLLYIWGSFSNCWSLAIAVGLTISVQPSRRVRC